MGLIEDYVNHGWQLVSINPGGKGPVHSGWNTRLRAVKRASELPPGFGVGLMHAYSGTMALDIDDWDLTKREFGLDLDALYAAPDAVTILSGRPGRGKLLYRMPFGIALPSKRFTVPVPGGPTSGHTKRITAFELRCGTSDDRTVQDILPPTIHPDTGKPYEWGGAGDWRSPPMLPDHILAMWQAALVNSRPVVVSGVDASWDEIREAIGHVDPDCPRDEWIQIGMALHWAGTQAINLDQAFAVWNEWSKRGAKYPGEHAILKQWYSLRTDKGNVVTLGTAYHIARQYGWVRATPDASTLFSSVGPAPDSPDAILRSLTPQPPDLDLDLVPALLARRAREVGSSVGCDPIVPLWAGLAAVCGVVDARSRLELMPGFEVPPVLWMMTIGAPSDKKSPGSRPMMSSLKAIELTDRPRYAQDMLSWEVKMAAYSTAKKALLEFAGSDEALLGSEAPSVPAEPPKPVPVKITVSDITSQKLVRQAADRPRGLLCYLDEMNSWVTKLTSRNSGEDRSAWVMSYESVAYEMDRVADGSIHADNFAVSVYGNIQPRVLADHFKELTSDGLLQRFLPAVLRSDMTRLGHPVPESATNVKAWEDTLSLIYALPTMQYKLSSGAYDTYRKFQGWYENQKRNNIMAGLSDEFQMAFGKLEGLVGRLALVWHVIEAPFAQQVSDDLMTRVIKFVRTYAIPAYRYVYDTNNPGVLFDRWVTDYVIQHADQETIDLVDIRRSARRQFENMGIEAHIAQCQTVVMSMHYLEQSRWVCRIDDGSKETRGIASWLVNPVIKDMFIEHRKAVIRAKNAIHERAMLDTHGYIQAVQHGQEILEDE